MQTRNLAAIAIGSLDSTPNGRYNASGFDIRDHIDKLTPARRKGHYVCPVCNGNHLSFNSRNYQGFSCLSGKCDTAKIREAISPWDEKEKGDNPIARNPKKIKIPPKPAPIPEGEIVLARLPQPVTHPEKKTRGNRAEIEYLYSDTQWAVRTEKPNEPKVVIPHHINEKGEPTKGKGKAAWNPYRWDEAEAHSPKRWVLVVEGEKCVETARSLGLVATTFQGASWGEDDLTRAALQCKSAGIAGIVFFPDHDDEGYKKAEDLEKAAAKAQLPFLELNPLDLWNKCPDKGDIANWVEAMDWQREELVRRLEEQFNLEAESIRENQRDRDDAAASKKDDIPDSFSPLKTFQQFTFNALYNDKHWICVGGELYCWDETYYKKSPDFMEEKRIADFCNTYGIQTDEGIVYPYTTNRHVAEALGWAKKRLTRHPDLINPPGINCANGVVSVRWENNKPIRHFEPHDPNKHLYLYKSSVVYNPDADSTNCERLLQTLDEPQQKIVLKIVASAIDLLMIRKLRGRDIKVILACGLGANGKDALRRTVSTIFGHEGITSVSLGDFAEYDKGHKFYVAPLIKSRVNWASENSQTARLDRIQSLKLFATGDTMHSEWKNKQHVEFTPKGIGIFNLNETPALQGTMQAIQDRFVVIKFNKTFKNNPNPNDPNELQADPRFAYDDEFIQTEVAPAFLNKMFDALEALVEEGIDYSCTSEAFRTMQKENNHLMQFCEDARLEYDPNGILTAMDIWSLLEEWYEGNGTLEIDDGKRIWTDQAKPGDKNVKAPNQVLARFRQLFPKTTLITISDPIRKKQIQALKGISFNSAPIPAPVEPISAPMPPQLPPQQSLPCMASAPVTPVSPTPAREEEKTQLDIAPPSFDEPSPAMSLQLGVLGRNPCESRETGAATGAENDETGAESIQTGAGIDDLPNVGDTVEHVSTGKRFKVEQRSPQHFESGSWHVALDSWKHGNFRLIQRQ